MLSLLPSHRKKKALALTAAPQPNPKRQKGGAKSSPEQDPAPFSDSPTVKLRADYALLRPYLQASEPPLPWSGIAAYEDNECKSQLQSPGRYECTLGVPELPFLHSFAPAWGQVQRTVDLWKADMTVEEDGQVVLTWPAVIALQAQEGCRPTPGDVKLLSNENVFLSRLVCNDSPVVRRLYLETKRRLLHAEVFAPVGRGCAECRAQFDRGVPSCRSTDASLLPVDEIGKGRRKGEMARELDSRSCFHPNVARVEKDMRLRGSENPACCPACG